MNDQVLGVGDADFAQQVLASELPVVVDFWAPWCKPCQDVAPVIASMAETYAGKVRFVKLNVDENPEITSQMGIRGLPTLMLLRDGEVVNTKVGALPAAQITAWLDSRLNG
ncbi:thioredoxin [Marinobacterium rhizophilum]|uniref:Thioredoxin n=1 Tax=Marinobacterium rhizophilum TaxID=420402 RepID=A0ABY5HLI6_9GAMM|nr:thioredoxin [Marinobacterium rhizophilum]UTW13242.1 thioredoxin [Marinobacterium rhizophilum]